MTHEMEHTGIPWLDYPLALHSSRDYECNLNSTTLCSYKERYWLFWYEADRRYALPTIAFFLSTIILFAIAHFFIRLVPRSLLQKSPFRTSIAVLRYLSYKSFRIPFLNWNSAPIGILALGAVGFIYFMCMVLAPGTYYWSTVAHFGHSPPLATRSGWLSLACLPFVFATAGKSNLITLVTGVSHEKLQLFHRWISYAFFVTALLHTFPFIVYGQRQGDLRESWNTSIFYWTGVVALVAQAWLTFASMSPLRSISYEWFKFSHFVAALVFVLFLFFHCDYILTSWDYFIATGVLFAVSWLHRQGRLYLSHGFRHRARVAMTENGWICVRVPTDVKWHAGQHFFVRFMTWNLHAGSIHPFTACSLPTLDGTGRSELVFYIQPQGGFTAWLARLAKVTPERSIRVLLDGPYGGVDPRKSMSCERQVLVAGGSGAGWLLPMVTAFLRNRASGHDTEHNPRGSSLRIVMATRDLATRFWFEHAFRDLLAGSGLEKQPEDIEIETHYTGSCGAGSGVAFSGGSGRSIESSGHEHHDKAVEAGQAVDIVTHSADSDGALPSSGSSGTEATPIHDLRIRHYDGRPDLAGIIASEAAATGANVQLGVFACGPLSMQSDVSSAVAREQVRIIKEGGRDVYLHMEHFSWA